MENNLTPNPFLPQPPLPIETIKKPFSFRWLSFVVGFLLIIILLGGVYLLGRNSASKTPTQLQTINITPSPEPNTVTPTPDPATTWVSFKIDEFGINVNAPKDWQIIKDNNSKTVTKYILSVTTSPCTQNQPTNCNPPDKIYFSKNPVNGLTLLEFIKNYGKVDKFNYDNVSIDGQYGIRTKELPAQFGIDNTFIKIGDNVFNISLIHNYQNGQIIDPQTFTSILNSVKFPNQPYQNDATTDWKIYNNTDTDTKVGKIGFSIKYPDPFRVILGKDIIDKDPQALQVGIPYYFLKITKDMKSNDFVLIRSLTSTLSINQDKSKGIIFTDKVINGLIWKQYKSNVSYIGIGDCSAYGYVIEHNNLYFNLFTCGSDITNFEKMMSTFKINQ
jgi:hypothetical protein